MARNSIQRPVFSGQALGDIGIPRSGGFIADEFLPELSGTRGMRTYREMADNDPTCGAILFAIEMLLRNAKWSFQSASDDSKAEEAKVFVEEVFDDMAHSWEAFIADVCTMFTYGFAPMEIIWKKRGGDTTDKTTRSKFDDEKVGIRKLSLRAAPTVMRWEFDPNDDGEIVGLYQQPPVGTQIYIPAEKFLLFRTSPRGGNPQGRALDPETPIPTPDGWRQLDDLQPGDRVFDEQGRIRYITARADWNDRPCYEVEFNGGHSIIADANHQWWIQSFADRHTLHRHRILTTETISQKVKTKGGVTNYSIPWASALDYPKQHLIVDPYYLGLWLGDGTATTASISCHAQDLEETVSLIHACGYTTKVSRNGAPESNGRSISVRGDEKWASDGPVHLLRSIGVLHNKHIPESYLRSSIEQRTALLAGLMDSDGYIAPDGSCEFVNTNLSLIFGVQELVRSLGVNARALLRHKANPVTSHKQDAWAVRFTPNFVPFRLSRKVSKCRLARARTNHYVVAVRPVSNRRTVCIEVDGPSHLFLAGQGLVPTHNSLLRNAYRPWHFKRRIEEFEGIGVERDLAGLPVARIPSEYMRIDADANQKAFYETWKKLVTSVRRDQSEGIVIPSDRDSKGNLIFDFALMSTGGSRSFDTTTIVDRWDKRIASSVLADFIFLGQSATGSYALSSDKTTMFATAIGGFMRLIASVINGDLLPRLWYLNGLKNDLMPIAVPGDIEREDLDKIGSLIERMTGAGARMFPDRELENDLRERAGLPKAPEEGEDDYLEDPRYQLDPAKEQEEPPEPVVESPQGELPLPEPKKTTRKKRS